MRSTLNRSNRCVLAGIATLFVLASVPLAAQAGLINLEWRPTQQTVNVGDIVSIGLYAVPASGITESISAVQVLLQWDPLYLGTPTRLDNGPYSWLSSNFPPIDPWRVNASMTDGNALYMSTCQLGMPATATPAGLLVTTIRLQALAATPLGSPTVLQIPATIQADPNSGTAYTRVIGSTPGLDVHGTLGSTTITVLPEPAGLLVAGLGLIFVLRRR